MEYVRMELLRLDKSAWCQPQLIKDALTCQVILSYFLFNHAKQFAFKIKAFNLLPETSRKSAL